MTILSPKQRLQIRSLHAEGLKTVDIAKRVGIHRTTVLRHVGPTRIQDWDAIRRKVERLEEQGIFKRKEQAKLLGIHPNSLRNHLGGRPWLSVTAEDAAIIRERYSEGETTKQLAFEYRCSATSILSVINRKGRFANI
jgi:DNA invertase Pin-like site-specific DNA recombinase